MVEDIVNLNLNNTDIRQFTNDDINSSSISPEKANKITVEKDPVRIHVNGATQEASRDVDVIYVTFKVDGTLKLSYSCDEVARKLPIYIYFKDEPDPREFYIGKTGMFEIQPETQKNVNGTEFDDLNGRVYSVQIEYIKVPYKYKVL